MHPERSFALHPVSALCACACACPVPCMCGQTSWHMPAKFSAFAPQVWSIAWNPTEANILAVGCWDGLLKFYQARLCLWPARGYVACFPAGMQLVNCTAAMCGCPLAALQRCGSLMWRLTTLRRQCGCLTDMLLNLWGAGRGDLGSCLIALSVPGRRIALVAPVSTCAGVRHARPWAASWAKTSAPCSCAALAYAASALLVHAGVGHAEGQGPRARL